MIDGIIFDLDGTLWDSTESVTESWNVVIERRLGAKYRITPEDMAGAMGLIMMDLTRKIFPDLPYEEAEALLMESCAYENIYVEEHGGKLYPGLIETLTELKKRCPLFIVSNCHDGYTEAFFKAHNTESFFKDYENPGRTGQAKAANIRLVVERNGLKHPIYVGDTAGDQKAAKEAGVPFVFARYGFGDVEDYDGVIDSLPELLNLF